MSASSSLTITVFTEGLSSSIKRVFFESNTGETKYSIFVNVISSVLFHLYLRFQTLDLAENIVNRENQIK